MVLIGLISDTHDHVDVARKAVRVFRERDVEMVVHLGDIVAPFTLKAMAEEKPPQLTAIFGNNCGEKMGLKRTAEAYGITITDPPRILEIKGYKILLLHGFGSREDTERIVLSLAKSGDYDFIFFGHTHSQYVKEVGSTFVVNPGEAGGCLTGRKSISIVDLDERMVETILL